MAFEIVDGMTGTKHISSDDLSALNVATIGKADCVLKYGDDFKLTMASANSATIGTGVGMVGGKRFWNQAATSLTIQSGTQGQKRNDLVVARYAKTSAGIESITPVVIKGTPSADTAADPATTANDLKLWRVPLDGINAGTPVRLFEPVTPFATLEDSVATLGDSVATLEDSVATLGDSVSPVKGLGWKVLYSNETSGWPGETNQKIYMAYEGTDPSWTFIPIRQTWCTVESLEFDDGGIMLLVNPTYESSHIKVTLLALKLSR